jgi:hypothetical protein
MSELRKEKLLTLIGFFEARQGSRAMRLTPKKPLSHYDGTNDPKPTGSRLIWDTRPQIKQNAGQNQANKLNLNEFQPLQNKLTAGYLPVKLIQHSGIQA